MKIETAAETALRRCDPEQERGSERISCWPCETVRAKDKVEVKDEAWRKGSVEERLKHRIGQRITDISTPIRRKQVEISQPLDVIEVPDGRMNVVGELFERKICPSPRW